MNGRRQPVETWRPSINGRDGDEVDVSINIWRKTQQFYQMLLTKLRMPHYIYIRFYGAGKIFTWTTER